MAAKHGIEPEHDWEKAIDGAALPSSAERDGAAAPAAEPSPASAGPASARGRPEARGAAPPQNNEEETLPKPEECPFCGGGGEVFFYTIHGWWQCRHCHPPAPGEEAEPPPVPGRAEAPERRAALDEARRFLDALYRRLSEELPPSLRSWAAACRPDLLAAVDEADAVLDAALARLEEDGSAGALNRVKEAAEALEAAWRRAGDAWPVAWASRRDAENGILALAPKPAASAADREAFEAWLRGELRIPAEIRWIADAGVPDPVCDAAALDGESKREESQAPEGEPTLAGSQDARQLALRFEGEAGAVDGTGSAPASPWEAWLSAVEIEEVRDPAGWRRALDEARAAGVCGVDAETTGLDPLVHKIRLVQLAVPAYPPGKKRLVAEDGRGPEPGSGAKVWVLDLFALDDAGRREALEGLAALFADRGAVKAGHNLKFDLAFLRSALGRRLAVERIFDAMLASQLCAAGDFVPGGRWEKWCGENGLTPAKNAQGQELKAVRVDAHGHLVVFEHDSQKDVRPFFATHSLQQVAHRHLEAWLEKEHQAADWSGELTPEMVRYAALDAAVLLPLREILVRLLSLNSLVEAAKIEFGCLPAVAEIELSGMPFDAGRARAMLEEAAARAAALRRELASRARAAGFWPAPKKSSPGGAKRPEDAWLNPDSGIDCAGCLRLMAEQEGVLAEGGRAFLAGGEELPLDSRDETLSRLAARLPEGSALRRFAEGLRAYRAAKKRADFLKKWLELAHDVDNRLHPDLRQINPQGVGRLSASKPNLQQVAREPEMRSLFRAPEGRKLVMSDFSAVEMRVAAAVSGDGSLLKAFRDGVDVHKYTAAFVSGKPMEEVTKAERQFAKSLNFGLVFGMSPATLREYAELGYGVSMSLQEAEAAREKFFRLYRGLAAWHERSRRLLWEEGFGEFWRHDFARGFYMERRPCARTLSGRMRVWPAVEEKRDGRVRLRKAGAMTEVLNSPVQGGASDLLKLSMAKLYRKLLERGWEDVLITLSVHDELHLEAPEALAEEARDLLAEAMVEAGRELMLEVPVEVEAAVGRSWADKA